jgi:Caspase domain
MLVYYSRLAKGTLMSIFLLLSFCLPATLYAQTTQECITIYNRFRDNLVKNPAVSYESGKEYLRKCPNDDQYGVYVTKWTAAYERIERENRARVNTPEQSAPSQPARILEQGEARPSQTNVTVGRFYALVIGNDSYQYVRSLKTAAADAHAIESTLREQYGFDTRLLLNASRQDIFQAISYYRRNIEQNDNLVIYYAGHGYFDREADKAYWLPVDARREDSANWISADDITSNVRAVPARHVIIVSDSCYSGTLYRDLGVAVGEPIARDRFLQKMLVGKSRTLMASGGNEPVSDGGGDGHSVFARALLTGLSQTERSSFTASELFRDFVQERVAGGANQTPEYNPLRNSGHESGDFVFIRFAGKNPSLNRNP